MGFHIMMNAQEIEVYDDFSTFESNLIKDASRVYVINYWATWCAPCIKELPFFEKLREEYKGKGVEVVLVSIDFKNQYESKLLPFIQDRKLKSRLIHMADPRANNWIPKVDDSWSGAIPITIFRMGKDGQFMEQSFDTYEDLKLELDRFLATIQ